MSPESTRKTVQAYYDAFNAGDPDGMIACLSAAFVHDVNEGDRRQGRRQFREFLDHMNRCYREALTDMVIMTSADGTRAAAEFVVNGTYLETDPGLPQASGQTYRLPAGAFLEIREDGIARVTTYYNLRDWIAQVEGQDDR